MKDPTKTPKIDSSPSAFEMKTITKSSDTITTITNNNQHQNTQIVEIQMENVQEENDVVLKGSNNNVINISETVLVHSQIKPQISETLPIGEHPNMIDVGLQKEQQEFFNSHQDRDVQDKSLELKSADDIVYTASTDQYRQEPQDDIADHENRRLSAAMTADNFDEDYENDIDEESKSVKSANTATTDISNSNLSSIVSTTSTLKGATSGDDVKGEILNNRLDSIPSNPVKTDPVNSTTPTKLTCNSNPYQETLDCHTPSSNGSSPPEKDQIENKGTIKDSSHYQGESKNSLGTPSKDNYQKGGEENIKSPDKSTSSRSGTEQSSNSSTTLSERGNSSSSLISHTSASTMSGMYSVGGRRDDFNKETRPSSRISNMSYSSQIGMNEVCNSMSFFFHIFNPNLIQISHFQI